MANPFPMVKCAARTRVCRAAHAPAAGPAAGLSRMLQTCG
jgi:hypothetical protein